MMKQLTVRSSILTLCTVIFCFVLAACGTATSTDSGSTASKPTAAPTPTPIPTPTPTPAPSLTAVTGDGFTIGSPSGWTSKKSSLSVATLLQISPNGADLPALVVETIPSTTGVSPTGSTQGALNAFKSQAKNFQTKDAPTTVTINGIQWDQGAATADDPASATPTTVYVLSTKFPNNANKLATIIYTAKTSEFDKVNTEDFQPMLLTFKFV